MSEQLSSELAKALVNFGTDFVRQYHASMDAKEAAAFLKVSKNELLRYAKAGLKFYRSGRKYTFTMQDLIDFRENFRNTFGREMRTKKVA
jgi:hypothetical protein